MLAAVAKARVIGPRPVDLRRLAVVLLEARAHLALKLLLQGQCRREQRVGISVFGLEERANVARQLARIAQDLAPVLSPDPGIIVGPGEAVGGEPRWPNLGAGRRRDWGFPACSADRSRSRVSHGAPRSPKGSPSGSAKKAAGTSKARRTRSRRPPREARPRRHSPRARRWSESRPARGDHVISAIAPHAAIARLEPLALENMGDQIAFVVVAAIELGAVHPLEMALKIEVSQDALRINGRLCGAETTAPPPRGAPPRPRARLRRR